MLFLIIILPKQVITSQNTHFYLTISINRDRTKCIHVRISLKSNMWYLFSVNFRTPVIILIIIYGILQYDFLKEKSHFFHFFVPNLRMDCFFGTLKRSFRLLRNSEELKGQAVVPSVSHLYNYFTTTCPKLTSCSAMLTFFLIFA